MTYDDIIALLAGRIERGVTQRTQIGRDSQWQRVTLCLELHRLMELLLLLLPLRQLNKGNEIGTIADKQLSLLIFRYNSITNLAAP